MTGTGLAAETRRWMGGVFAQCDALERGGGARTRAWQIGPLTLGQTWYRQRRFEFFHRPLAHLPAAVTAALRIDCVDAGDGIDLGAAPFRKRDLGPNRSISGLAETPFRVLWDQDHRFVQALDLAAGRGFFFVADYDRLPEWEPPIPFRNFVHWWAAAEGHLFLHAGSAGIETGGVAFLGRGGAGKSTTTLACIDAGLATCGDDYVLITLGQTPEVHAIYGTAKIENAAALRPEALFRRLERSAVSVGDKTLLFPAVEIPGSFAPSFPLKALAALEIGGGAATRIEPVSPMAALRAAAPSTVLQLPLDQGHALKAIAALARSLPCVRITLGRDLGQAGAAIASYVHGLGAVEDPLGGAPERRAARA